MNHKLQKKSVICGNELDHKGNQRIKVYSSRVVSGPVARFKSCTWFKKIKHFFIDRKYFKEYCKIYLNIF